MRLESYNEQVKPNTGPSGGLQGSGSIEAYGGQIASGLQAFQKGVNDLYNVQLKKIDTEMKLQQMNAETDYNNRIADLMYNDKTGLTYTTLQDASNSAERFRQEEAKIREDISSKLQYKRSQQGFLQHADQSWLQNNTKMESHEREQGDKYRDVSVANFITSSAKVAQLGYTKMDIVKSQLDNVYKKIDEIYGYEGEEAVRARKDKATEELLQGVLHVAGTEKNNKAIDDIIDVAKDAGMMPEKYKKFEEAAKEFKVNAVLEDEVKLRDVLAKNGNDPKKAALYMLEKENPLRTGNMSLESFLNAVQGQESGGDPTAVNKKSGAYGLFQIMPENWPEWSKQAGVGDKPITDQDAYMKVVRHVLGGYFNKYGAEGALVAWFAGEQNAIRWVNGEPDAIDGNGNHYSWDKEDNGGGTSIRNYVKSTISRITNSHTMTDGEKAEFLAKAEQRFTQIQAKIKREHDEAVRKQVRDITLMADHMEKNGASPGEIAEAVSSAASDDPDVKAAVIGMEKSYRRQQETLNARAMQAGPANEAMIMEAIYRGESSEYVMNLMANSGISFSNAFYNKVYSLLEDRSKGTGRFSAAVGQYKSVVQDKLRYSNKDMNALWVGADEEAAAYRTQYYSEHGEYPSDSDMVNFLVEAVRKKEYTYVRNWAPDVHANVSRTQVRAYGGDDHEVVPGDDGGYYVNIYKDGEIIRSIDVDTWNREHDVS
ncbi:lytic transglycosylase domain-containing protein [Veillonella sp. CHU732]|uniref:lytic transglycosylase domain-containing protein n=1 Tax=Veillonella sp. CHU732 TaxID=2490949 RepID=UPI000F8C4754|nr:lytic transglycosylase domain-containing protein [Veillonella sp. CHU732]